MQIPELCFIFSHFLQSLVMTMITKTTILVPCSNYLTLSKSCDRHEQIPGPVIEEHHRCFELGGYFMAAVLAAASYSRGGFSPYLAVSARRFMVPGGSTFHLEPGTIHPCWNLTGT